jgi:hypothetical protein
MLALVLDISPSARVLREKRYSLKIKEGSLF